MNSEQIIMEFDKQALEIEKEHLKYFQDSPPHLKETGHLNINECYMFMTENGVTRFGISYPLPEAIENKLNALWAKLVQQHS